MWSLSFPGRGRGNRHLISKTFLLKEYCHGLAPQERNVILISKDPFLVAESGFRLTALFLATKTTNNPISLEAYTAQIPRTEPSDVLDLEFLVAQSLNFEFSVWHAHRALWGIYLDVQVRSCYHFSVQ